MKFFTPARVTALLWLGGVGVLVWLTLVPSSLLSWSDPIDSAAQLSAERACTLARAATPGGLDPSSGCSGFKSDPEAAQLVVNGHTVCFLKAGRWFIADLGLEIPCPTGAPMEAVRIVDFDDERHGERRWSEAVHAGRLTTVVNGFPDKLRALVTRRRSQRWPAECPPLPAGKVEALDANLVALDAAKWHFLTGEMLEAALLAGTNVELRSAAIDRLRRVPTLLLIDASVKVLPGAGAPGRLEATASLVDWRHGEVLCERPFSVVQNAAPEVDHGKLPDLAPVDTRLPDFQERVGAALAEVTRELSDGGLVLEPTW